MLAPLAPALALFCLRCAADNVTVYARNAKVLSDELSDALKELEEDEEVGGGVGSVSGGGSSGTGMGNTKSNAYRPPSTAL